MLYDPCEQPVHQPGRCLHKFFISPIYTQWQRQIPVLELLMRFRILTLTFLCLTWLSLGAFAQTVGGRHGQEDFPNKKLILDYNCGLQ